MRREERRQERWVSGQSPRLGRGLGSHLGQGGIGGFAELRSWGWGQGEMDTDRADTPLGFFLRILIPLQ